MARIPIDNLAAGMILKSAIHDRSGRLLMPDGAELTDKHLKIFRTWGIAEADIVLEQDDDATTSEAPASCDPADLAEAEASVARIFIRNDPSHPFVRELMRLCSIRKATADA